MLTIAGTTALAVLWVVLPIIDIMSGPDETQVSTSSPKGDFVLHFTPRTTFKRQANFETTQHPEVSPKGDFLGWFPDTGNIELEFQITQTEDPLRFETPKYKTPNFAEQTTTRLVAFANAPFPFYGREPRSNRPFMTKRGGELVHVTGSGRVFKANQTFADPRALIHIPKGFDIEAPGVIVVFYHGHGATLRRDIYQRQRVPQQITHSGVNAVLVAPQFAVNARSSSAGKLWEKGGLRRFLDEVAVQLAAEHGAPGAHRVFAKMPVVIVAYSGGFEPAAWSVSRGGLGDRVKGLVLLDALYGHVDRFANWIKSNRSAFVINAYAGGSPRRNSQRLKTVLRQKGIPYRTHLNGQLWPGNVVFLSAVTSHRNYVTKAWTKYPIADMLRRLHYVLGDPPVNLRTLAATQ